MSPERRQRIRTGWGATLTFVRNWTALALGVFFSVVGTHGELIHDRGLAWPDVATMFLGACCIFGFHGLQIYRDAHHAPSIPSIPDAGPG